MYFPCFLKTFKLDLAQPCYQANDAHKTYQGVRSQHVASGRRMSPSKFGPKVSP